MMTNAYRIGHEAGKLGLGPERCPFPSGTDAASAFWAGYSDAHRDEQINLGIEFYDRKKPDKPEVFVWHKPDDNTMHLRFVCSENQMAVVTADADKAGLSIEELIKKRILMSCPVSKTAVSVWTATGIIGALFLIDFLFC